MSRTIAQFAREIGEDEITIRTQIQRGYRLPDLELIYGKRDSPARVAGEAKEAAIRRHYAMHKRLPCGEELRVVNGRDPEAVKRYEHDVWKAFQFETGTDGDSLVSGGGEFND